MSWKEFFKQNLMKSLVLTLILLVISTLIVFLPYGYYMSGIQTYGIPFSGGGDGYFPPKPYNGIGFPLMFYAYDYEALGPPEHLYYFPSLYNYYNFIIDVIFWYLISCLIILVYNKSKSKDKRKK